MPSIALPFLVAAVVQALLAVGLLAWAGWVARRQRGRWWRRARWLPGVALGLALIGIASSGYFIARALTATSGSEPSMKATLLAQNISEAMNCAACFALPAWGLYLISVVLCVVGSVKRAAA